MRADQSRDPLGISGTVIADKYRIEHAVGAGGFSVVYLAEHLIWRQPVAIKCFNLLANAPEGMREGLLDGFIQEGKLMAALSTRSAAIVQARDVGTFTTPDGKWLPYMVLEWLEGKALDYVLYEENSHGLPPRSLHETIALLDPAAAALAIAHSRGIAHRDVKPANFFVIGDPRGVEAHVKVLDFGIAKVMADHAVSAASQAQTGKEISAFTPNYGAPEQFSRTHGATGPWTDVFAMALILVEMMRGGGPALDGEDFIQLAVASRDPHVRPSPRRFGIEVPEAVEQVFLRALAVSPVDRYPTMGQFWAGLFHAVFPDSPTWTAATGAGHASFAGGGSLPSPSASARGNQVGLPPLPEVGAPPRSSAMPASAALRNSGIPQSSGVISQGRPVVRPPSSVSLLVAMGAGAALITGGFGAYWSFGRGSRGTSMSAALASVAAPIVAASASALPATSAVAARRTTCPTGTVMIPGGRFFMGSDDAGFDLWKPAHKVTLDTFCIDTTEVTAAAYKACSDVGECKRPDPIPSYPKAEGVTDSKHEANRKAQADLCNFGKPGRENHPINCVTWSMAESFCAFRKARLPTEAEWEFAARGSDGRKFPWGDEPGAMTHMNACGVECNRWEREHGLRLSSRMYDTDDGFPGTAPVGSFPKGNTRLGASDFIGNVWEWTHDWFEIYKPEDVMNPGGAPAGDRKAIRGGGFNGGTELWLNPAFRYHQLATASAPAIGFRCALNL
jgi:eukaryotic-like serine/threonine-protein kinase